MDKNLNTIRPAATAIAAVLAFSATPLLAQQAPVIVLPDAPAAQSPAVPAPVAPPAAAAPPQAATTEMVSEPMVQAVPAAEQPAPETGAETATSAEPVAAAPQAAPRAAAPAPISAPAPQQQASIAPEDSAEADVADASPLAQGALGEGLANSADNAEVASVAPTAQPVDDAVVETSEDGTGALLAGGAVIGLGLLGFAAFRRRKPGNGAPPVVVKPAVTQKEPVTTAAPINATTGNFDRAAPTGVSQPTTLHRKPLAAATAMGAAGGAVPLPRSMPESFEERDALLRRMVAAKPDRANPFHAPQARVRRARLIMQSLGQDFADRDPQFDTRDYPNNWPLVARRNYATAA